eukprot:2553551-Prymnesium_polylepis.2
MSTSGVASGFDSDDIDLQWQQEVEAWSKEQDKQDKPLTLKKETPIDQISDVRRELKTLLSRFRRELRDAAEEHRLEMRKMLADLMAEAALDAALAVRRNLEQNGWKPPLQKIEE